MRISRKAYVKIMGTYEHWASRDLLARAAEPTKRQVRVLADTESSEGTSEDDDVNRMFFQRHKDTPWNDVATALEGALRAALQ